MTQQHIAFPSIGQFRDAIKHVRDSAKWNQVPVPTLKLHGTVKLHGSNHGICRPLSGGVDDIWTQSRERITTPTSDNAGSSMFTYARRDWFNRFFDILASSVQINEVEGMFIQVYGEFCCGNIQKGVGLTQIKDKKFVMFKARISKDAASSNWIPMNIVQQAMIDAGDVEHIHCITQFPMFEITCDFNNPEAAQNQMVEITNKVEADCPVARHFLGADYTGDNIGEGVVWEIATDQETPFDLSSLILKVKGERHSASKVKTVAAIDVEKVASINEFVEYAMTENRMQQGLTKLVEMGLSIETKNTSAFLKWVVSDAIREEMDTLAESGLSVKDVTSKLSVTARNWFLQRV